MLLIPEELLAGRGLLHSWFHKNAHLLGSHHNVAFMIVIAFKNTSAKEMR